VDRARHRAEIGDQLAGSGVEVRQGAGRRAQGCPASA
jgi:hypothetical protein